MVVIDRFHCNHHVKEVQLDVPQNSFTSRRLSLSNRYIFQRKRNVKYDKMVWNKTSCRVKKHYQACGNSVTVLICERQTNHIDLPNNLRNIFAHWVNQILQGDISLKFTLPTDIFLGSSLIHESSLSGSIKSRHKLVIITLLTASFCLNIDTLRPRQNAICQMTHAVFLTKMCEFWLRFHWRLFLRVQLTIFRHWFR